MDNYELNKRSWAQLAQEYSEKFMHLSIYNHTYDALCHLLKLEGARVLDAGCGPGNISYYLLSQRPDLQVLGIDQAEEMILCAREWVPLASFECLDIKNLNTLMGTFDAITAGFCIPYLSVADTRIFIHDAARLLARNGILYLSYVEGPLEKSGRVTGSTGHSMYFWYYTRELIDGMLQDAGLCILESFEILYTRPAAEAETHRVVFAALRH